MTDPDTDAGPRVTRRRVVQVGAASLAVPGFASVTRGATSSGNVELTTTATVPTSTSIDIEVFEDADDDGTAELTESHSIPDGTGVVTEYSTLVGEENSNDHYWMEISLSTTDDTVTPELDSVTITLPEQETTTTTTDGTTTDGGTSTTTDDGGGVVTSDGPSTPGQGQGIGALWRNYRAFIALVVLAFAAIGGWSKSLTIGAFAGYLAFLYLALQSSNQMFQNIAIVTLVLTFLGMAFKLNRLEFEGET